LLISSKGKALMPEKWTYETTIFNDNPTTMEVVLEPWGDSHSLPPGEYFELMSRGPKGRFVLYCGDNRLEVHAWEGSVLELWRGGRVVDPGKVERPPVPPVPEGYRP
jgi:hypothetical protein